MAADSHRLKLKFQPNTYSINKANAYTEMPEARIVITANKIALSARVFSSKRNFKNSGNRPGFRAIIKPHHKNGKENHGRDGTDPIKVSSQHSIFRTRTRHAHYFQCAQIGGNKSQTGYPCRKRTACREKLLRILHVLTQQPSNA